MLMFGLAALLVAVIMLVIFGGQDKIAGLEPSVFAGIATSGVLLLAWSGWFASQLRHDLRNTVQAIAAWGAIFIAMIAFYTYRFEFQDAANRVLAEIAPGMAISSRAGEVVIARSNSGSFLLSGRINGKPAQMIFDTGASRVVLTAETAASLALPLPKAPIQPASRLPMAEQPRRQLSWTASASVMWLSGVCRPLWQGRAHCGRICWG